MSMSFAFELQVETGRPGPRAGVLHTPHGDVFTPAFCPADALGAGASLAPDELREAGAELLVADALAFSERPGSEAVTAGGGLHGFLAWTGPLLASSQSLTPHRVDADGATHRSRVDGSLRRLTPETFVDIQSAFGVDIATTLAPPLLAGRRGIIRDALDLALSWARRALEARADAPGALFGTVPPGPPTIPRALAGLPLDGFAAAGPGFAETLAELPEDRPRYLGEIDDPVALFDAVEAGGDLLGSAEPVAAARRGLLYTREGIMPAADLRRRGELTPIEAGCSCLTCRQFTRAYLWHLFAAHELLAYRLAAIHNLHFVSGLVRRIRTAILEGTFPDLRRGFEAGWR